MLDTKFDELMDFPCAFPFKVVGEAHETLTDKVVAVVQKHAPGDYSPSTKTSSKGSYHSITIRVTVTSKDHIEILYTELAAIEGVRRVL
ncbi:MULTISPECIES: DUF493 family protein YbeD [Shewanella]|jgi:putative lipoic acid-binding regulatory protein|uniref:UPF0250 protein Sbal223_1087 n=6 Tax=Shewanella TaxID=22 RepID=Y1087_SHEB2|nr:MULTISPECIES: DUF493 family protein YbeD [Shewanella]A3D7P7.1 RecName: Full=UPF0250 protein Sbal_3280 [Shewanella baltica OS155]A6WRL0.1 RecName: Full=UPF0250 protein Shew185_3322 [Shewanella baltica OS185]A9L012.1 RecName: Full=UPF0250 protein Sbal195_3458 [Shewanella baltica OS195]B8E4W6.1 RecName: Full=UPF0250 protein Sbal223_1087 [Shewanella baltica OS223]RBP81321.1 hypothetical protein DET47_10323 [Shewanella putrefaciens]GCF89297.1 UPF0250 protein [Shewanella sp. M-Br]ABN62760.1 pro